MSYPSPDDTTAAIDAMAREIQALPDDTRWLFCDSDWIVAAALGQPLAEGKATAQISRILAAAAFFRAEVMIVGLASFLLLIGLWFGQFRIRPSCSPYLVGIDALREGEIVPQFAEEMGRPVTVIDQRDPVALAAMGRVRLSSLLRTWAKTLDVSARYLATAKISRGAKMACLNRMVRRLHIYTYSLAVFQGLKARDSSTPVAFSTCDLPAHAAVTAGLQTIFYQSGLLRHSLVIPSFSKAVPFSRFGAALIQGRSPSTVVRAPPEFGEPIGVNRCVAIVGEYDLKNAPVCREFVETAISCNFKVIVRPHPMDKTLFWKNMDDDRIIYDRDGTFEEFIARNRPAFLASWASTTLFDALAKGIVPITLRNTDFDLAFPLSQIALIYPKDREKITFAMNDNALRTNLLKSVRSSYLYFSAYTAMLFSNSSIFSSLVQL